MEKSTTNKKNKKHYDTDRLKVLKNGKPYRWAGPIDNDIAIAIFQKKESSDLGASVIGIVNAALRKGLKEEIAAQKPKPKK